MELNVTSGESCETPTPFSDAILITTRCILTTNFAFGMPGNAALCFIITSKRDLRTPTNILIVNLAISGFIQCAICAPMLFHFANLQDDVVAALPLCICQHFFRAMTSMLQVFTLVAIGFERFQAVAQPFQREERKRRVKIMIVSIWMLSVLVGILAVLFPDTTMNLICREFVDLCDDVEFVLNFNMFCVVPVGMASFCLTFVLYVAMVVLLRKQRSTLFKRPLRHRTKVTTLQLNTNNNSNRAHDDNDVIEEVQQKEAKERANKRRESGSFKLPELSTTEPAGGRKNDNSSSRERGHKSCRSTHSASQTTAVFQSSLSVTSAAEYNYDVKTSRATSSSASLQQRAPTLPLAVQLVTAASQNRDSLTPGTTSTRRKQQLTTSELSQVSLTSFESISTCENTSTKSVTTSVVADDADEPQSQAGQIFTIYTRSGETRTSRTGENLVGPEVVGDICLFDPIVREKGRRRVEAKAAKITIITVIIFAICWLPYPMVVIYMYRIPPEQLIDYPNVFDLFFFSVTLSVFGSTINLVVYGVGNLQIRNEVGRYWERIKKYVSDVINWKAT